MKRKTSNRLSIKELAAALPPGPNGKSRSRGYVHAMKKQGFVMAGKTSTLGNALRWLRRHRKFTWRGSYAPKTL